MGLRPSVKGDGGPSAPSSSSKTPVNNTNSNQPSASVEGSSPLSSSSSSSAPRREAWTARGQLLLNFHHAISRAINSPEMARRCSQIAEDMSRSEESTNNVAVGRTATARPLISSSSSSSSSTHSMAEEYGAEAALIVENKSKRDALVRNKSLAVGLFTFVALRSGRGLSAHARRSLAGGSSRSYSFDAMPVGSSLGRRVSGPSVGCVTPVTASAEVRQQPSALRKALRLTLDVSISTTLTLLSGTFLFMPRPSAYIEDMAQLPLVQGKSVYAEMVCPPLLREYRMALEQYGGRWPVMGSSSDGKKEGMTQEDVSLNIIRKFVENCSKRSKYEQALLEERTALAGLADDRGESAVSRLMKRIAGADGADAAGDSTAMEDGTVGRLGTVSVPSPGVPEDVEVDVDLDVFVITADDDVIEGGTGVGR